MADWDGLGAAGAAGERRVSAVQLPRAPSDLPSDYRFALEIRPDGSMGLDAAGERVTAGYGYSVAELTSRGGLFALVLPEDRGQAEAAVRDAIERGHVVTEVRLLTRSGAVRWVRFHAYGEVATGAVPVDRIVGVAHDITDEKHAEAERLTNAARLQTVFDRSSIGLAVVAPDGTLVAANPAYCAMVDAELSDVVGRPFGGHLAPDARELIRQRVASLVRGETEHLDVEVAWVRDDGTPIDVTVSVVADRHDTGELSHVVGFFRDVTETKRALAEADLAGAIIESADDAIIGKTTHGIITRWNSGAQRMYGYSADEAIGRHISMLAPADRTDEIDDILMRVGRAEHIAHLETTRLRKDGTPVEVSLAVSPVLDAEGRVVAASTIARDITARRAAEAERHNQMTGIVAAQRQERVRLARDLHDGLGQVLTSASLLTAAAEAEAADADVVVPSLGALRPVLDEALTATRTLVWRLRPVEIELDGLEHAIHTLAEKTRVRHDLDVATHVVGLDRELSALVQTVAYRVIQEATTNAVRHANATTLSMIVTRLGDELLVLVEDDGCGFDPASPTGSGAGLVGMRERVAETAGSLDVDSTIGGGTVVRARLPLAAAGPG